MIYRMLIVGCAALVLACGQRGPLTAQPKGEAALDAKPAPVLMGADGKMVEAKK
jgi:hypothetical protein